MIDLHSIKGTIGTIFGYLIFVVTSSDVVAFFTIMSAAITAGYTLWKWYTAYQDRHSKK